MSASPAVIAIAIAFLAVPAYAQSTAGQSPTPQSAATPSDAAATGDTAQHQGQKPDGKAKTGPGKAAKPAPKPAVPGQATDSQSGKAVTPPASGELGVPVIERAKPAPTPKVVPIPDTPKSLIKPEATPVPARAKEPDGASPPVTSEVRPRGVTHVDKATPATQADHVTVPFAAGSSTLDKKQEGALAAIAGRLGQDPNRRLEIRGYAPLPALDREAAARRLSLFRAEAVRAHLMSLGIPKERLVIYAMGSVNGDLDDKNAVRGAGKGSQLPPETFDRVELTFIH
ncbi:outer membrane protein OmpA-like peptidoglycan-associated protein [Nitrospirillum iridis]|uniref:Outer membrane protein OmpA-like peptidoglycan-associated protein n=2 Tax=Nitrospirillum iridis TaxID=765888 RepID=A0A7X0ATR8_9PROT|nr:outer membrane protein OmpA-like peptidoglycan-associated protein [Nitrospirillum iridis]